MKTKHIKKTKIIATIGPASMSKTILKKMFLAGMNCARINTAHGDFIQYKKMIENIRSVSKIPIMLDIKGPEIRVKTNSSVELRKGETVEVGFDKNSPVRFTYNLYNEIKKGTLILMEDGEVKTKVFDKVNGKLILKAVSGCTIKDSKSINIPSIKLKTPALSKKDKESIKFAIRNKVPYIALSFTRNAEDVNRIKRLMKGSNIGVISKIENFEGIENIDEIIDVSEGVMVARGDLGIEIEFEKLPMFQKEIIAKCNRHGKIVIVATQMLQSVIENPRATRAEISDVANAILDGADSVMLSGETAVGRYPINAINIMKKIALEVENDASNAAMIHPPKGVSEKITRTIFDLSEHLNPDAIIAITRSGYVPRMITKYRIDMPLIAVTDNKVVFEQLQLVYAVRPLLVKSLNKNKEIYEIARVCTYKGAVNAKDLVIFASGSNEPYRKLSRIEIHKIGDLLEFRGR